jgi:hypothetical protein
LAGCALAFDKPRDPSIVCGTFDEPRRSRVASASLHRPDEGGRHGSHHRSWIRPAHAGRPRPALAGPAQTKDDTIVYALQSDIDTWDPPGSVLREAIILGYQVFDHLAVRDLKTRTVGPNLAVSWKNIDDTT